VRVTEQVCRRCLFLLIFTIIFISGCAQPSAHPLPLEDQFQTVIQLPETTAGVGQPFLVYSGLRNDSKKAWEIRHDSPLIFIEIHGPDWEEQEPKVSLGVDQVEWLSAREMYDPDTANFLKGKRALKISEPGKYRLVGVAHFRILDPKTGENRHYTVRSQPMDIQIVPSDSSGAPQS
jgi:hypothetical protein